MYYYQSKKDDHEVIDILNRLADKYPTKGFGNCLIELGNKVTLGITNVYIESINPSV